LCWADFTLTPQNAAVVMAIELAAAQAGTLSITGIPCLLEDALAVLEGGNRMEPRQETLRATLDWSHALLGAAERTLFRRLAVFAGSFDLEAAAGACAGDGIAREGILRLLTALVDKSLVEPQVSDEDVRYHLLEPLRQYGWERLAAAGEVDTLRCCHAQYFTARQLPN
jgi:predicted ATPase